MRPRCPRPAVRKKASPSLAPSRSPPSSYEGDPLERRTNLSLPALGPWTDWQTPTEDDFRSLIDGWQGDSPLAWLNKNVGFRTTTMSPQNDRDRLSGHMWFRESFRPGFYLYVYRINLSEQDRPGPRVWYRSAYLTSGTLKCSGNVCNEDPSTINFSPATTGIPSPAPSDLEPRKPPNRNTGQLSNCVIVTGRVSALSPFAEASQ